MIIKGLRPDPDLSGPPLTQPLLYEDYFYFPNLCYLEGFITFSPELWNSLYPYKLLHFLL